MGVYNSVYADCTECGETVQFQSKAIYGALTYSISEVPKPIADDIEGDMERCANGHLVRAVIAPVTDPEMVRMAVE